jgi:uncharacterized protein
VDSWPVRFLRNDAYVSLHRIIVNCPDDYRDLSTVNFLMKSFITIGLLVLSNAFMTLAWYGHLKFKEMKWSQSLGLMSIILISWGIALFEYMLQVPANRVGFKEYGGPFSLVQLKVIQEVITLMVFVGFSLLFFKNETFRINHLIGFVFLVLAVYFIFKK